MSLASLLASLVSLADGDGHISHRKRESMMVYFIVDFLMEVPDHRGVVETFDFRRKIACLLCFLLQTTKGLSNGMMSANVVMGARCFLPVRKGAFSTGDSRHR